MINTVLSPKGGTGKSTITANLAGLLADFGYKVLMVDADPQQTLSSHYTIKTVADFGFRRLIEEVNVSDVISQTVIKNLDLIYCDDPDGELEDTISKAADGSFRLRNCLEKLRSDYDFIFIDTIGTKKGRYNDLGIYAADFILTPIQPESASAREFVRGAVKSVRTKQEDGTRMGYKAAPQVGFINLFDNTVDANTVMGSVFDTAAKLDPPLPMLNTIVHRTTVFPSATTARMPVHIYEPSSLRKSGSGLDVIRKFTEELLATSQSLCGLPESLPTFSIKEVSNG